MRAGRQRLLMFMEQHRAKGLRLAIAGLRRGQLGSLDFIRVGRADMNTQLTGSINASVLSITMMVVTTRLRPSSRGTSAA